MNQWLNDSIQQDVIDQPRRSNERRHRDQRALGRAGHRIEGFAIDDLKIIQPHLGLPLEDIERGGDEPGGVALDVFKQEPEVWLDYFEIVDRETLDPVASTANGALVAVAAFVGTTRLIDNLVLGVGSQ